MSAGIKGARISKSTSGRTTKTASIPGTGIYHTTSKSKAKPRPQQPSDGSAHTLETSVIEGARGTRSLLSNSPGVVSAPVVGLRDHRLSIEAVAKWANIEVRDGFCRGIRDAVLMPAGSDSVNVLVLRTVQDAPMSFKRRERKSGAATPHGLPAGRLGKREAKKLLAIVGEMPVRCVVYIDATPGLTGVLEARWFADAFDGEHEG